MKRNPNVQIQSGSWLLPVLSVALLVLQLVRPYQGWLVLLIGLGGAWIVGWVWTWQLARGLRLIREMRYGWAQVGDRFEERFQLINTSIAAAPWVEIVDESTLPTGIPDTFDRGSIWFNDRALASRVVSVGSRDSLRWYTEAVCARRGVFTIGPTTIRSGDPLGLWTLSLHNPATTTLMVMPPIVPLPAIEVAPGGRVGEGKLRAHTLERVVTAAEVRDWTPGEGLRFVHWPTTARRDSFFVRQLDSASASDWWIFLDMDRAVQAGEGQDSTDEHAIILAASLADRGLRHGRAVGMAAYADDLVWLSPRPGESQRWEILRALALLNRGAVPLGDLLTRTRASLRQLASLIIITASANGDWIDSLAPLIRRGATPTVLLLDAASFGGRADLRPTLAALTELGVAHYVIDRSLLNQPQAHPGTQGRWEWHVSPHGKAFAAAPRDAAWRALS
jgi:uncharacterized protein (DUF58 family)